MKDSQQDAKNYLVWFILSIVATIVCVLLCIFNNPETENDALFIIETVGISLSVNLFSTTVVIVFFNARDKKAHQRRQQSAARKISADIKRFLVSKPSTSSTLEFRDQLEYIRNIFHDNLSPALITEIDQVLSDPTPSREDISALSATITEKYGQTLFTPLKK